MAESSAVAVNQQATSVQYNNLRNDVLDSTLGHGHTGGTDGTEVARSLLFWSTSDDIGASATVYLPKGLHVTIPAGEVESHRLEMPLAGTLKYLRVRTTVVVAGGQTLVITVRINGADKPITCTLAAGQQVGTDLVNTEAVVAGDVVSIKAVNGNTVLGVHVVLQIE